MLFSGEKDQCMSKGNNWDSIGASKRAGISVPLFSVYSGNSVGIGDLTDLKLVIDLCKKTGASILQLLPMNEVGSTFCPYDAVSSFALEPAYISLDTFCAGNGGCKAKIKGLRKRFDAGSGYVNYGIREEKIKFLWDIFIRDKNGSGALKEFLAENSYWLSDFALFKALKAHHQGRPWYEWEECFRGRDGRSLDLFEKEHYPEIAFQKWLQWVASNQFKLAKEYAGKKKILIKGDLPILISRDSADVWAHPEFFKLDLAAGAPPDMYCAKGQRWGMPTYNWENIASDGYRYFKKKLKFAENFYDILRIDHVVGLFRIWSIPYDQPAENEGLNGAFDPADENTWKEHGAAILSLMLKNTNILLCAEDLGVIPKACIDTLKEMGIPGNDVQRWVKDWKVKHDFLSPKDYRRLSVAMLSTHDTTNWAAWWENEAGTVDEELFIRKSRDRGINYESVRSRLFNAELSKHGRLRWAEEADSADALAGILGKRKEEIMDFIDMYENTYGEKEKLWKHMGMKGPMREKCDPEIMNAALSITLGSGAVFCVELLIDYLYLADIFKKDPYEYRINRPGTINDRNWSLVIPMALEDLLKNKVLKKIKNLITRSGRI